MDPQEYRKVFSGSSRTYRYTDTGSKIIDIGSAVPLIADNTCKGFATVTKLTIDENTTTIEFTFSKIDEKLGGVLYQLYTHGNTATSDPYNTDAMMPGLYNGRPRTQKARNNFNDDEDDGDLPFMEISPLNRRKNRF